MGTVAKAVAHIHIIGMPIYVPPFRLKAPPGYKVNPNAAGEPCTEHHNMRPKRIKADTLSENDAGSPLVFIRCAPRCQRSCTSGLLCSLLGGAQTS